jgi:SAM-dependent methyltransferase
MASVRGGSRRAGATRGGAPRAASSVRRFFAEPIREFMITVPRRPVCVLQAGCLAPLRELGLGELTEIGYDITVSVVDADDPLAQAVLAQTRDVYDDVIVGDLRTVPLPPRGFDVVYCGHLLERVSHVQLVLDRLVSALRPGGLLLIRVTDRDSAWAALDRWLPHAARNAIWQRLHPGVPGPFPAIYEDVTTERGIASYTLMRGLVIAQRSAELTLPDRPRRLSSTVRVTCAAIARLSRGRLADSHDELLYVIRKPEDRFARVVGGLWNPTGTDPRGPRGRRWPAASGNGRMAHLDAG